MNEISNSLINNPRRAKQLIDYTGLEYGNIHPTDIDGLIEYKDSLYIIYEIKLENTKLPYGQKLALQRMADDFTKSKKKAIVLVCEHIVHDTDKPIMLEKCKVREVYYGSEKCWRPPNKELTAKEASNIILQWLYSLKATNGGDIID